MSTGDSEGPAWNKFWLSLDHETESMVSGDGSHPPITPGRSLLSPEITNRPNALDRENSVMPGESASHHGDDAASDLANQTPAYPEDQPFPFKFKAPSGRVHRLQVIASAGMADLIENVTAKLGGEVTAVGGETTFEDGRLGKSGYALSYLDNEGDTVSITTDQDLLDAITLARRSQREKVDLFVHDPEKPPMAATVDPRPALPPPPSEPTSLVRERRREVAEEEEQPELTTKRDRHSAGATSTQAQIIAGVPNEVLLPGAIVTLAVAIVAVFAVSRSGGR